MNFNGLVSWLSFDDSPTNDFCGKTVTAYGNPVIVDTDAINGKALQLDGSSYLKISDITLGGKDFYIDCWVNVDSSTPNYGRVLSIVNPSNGYHLATIRKSSSDATKLDFWANAYADVSQDNGYTKVSTINSIGSRVHVKLVYRYDNKRILFFINDTFTVSYDSCPQYNRQTFDIYIGAYQNGNQGLIGTIDELRIYDGTYLSSGNSTPPTAADYDNTCTLNADTQRKITNAALAWRYENPGDADDLILSSTVLTDLPATQSATGTAFYQTTRAKCFDLPNTPEVWMKFDVYFDGSNRWRAYDAGVEGVCGVTAQTDGQLGFFSNGTAGEHFSGICKTNQLQTVLLHMISGSTAGVIEAWVDGTKIYTYTGDVNHGSSFADIYLQSDGSGTFFSNVIISNVEIGLDENVDMSCNVEIKPSVLMSWIPLGEVHAKPAVYASWIPNGEIHAKPFIFMSWMPYREIHFRVQHNDKTFYFPLTGECNAPAFTVYHNGKEWYNELVDPSDARAGIVHLWHNSREWALSNQINVGAAVPATRQSSDTYQNYHYDLTLEESPTSNAYDWQWSLNSPSSAVELPEEFKDLPVINIIQDNEVVSSADVSNHLTTDGDNARYDKKENCYIEYFSQYSISTKHHWTAIFFDDYTPETLAIEWTTKITQNYITSPICPQITGMSSTDAFVIDDDGGAVMSIVDGYDLNAVPMGGLLDYDLSVTSVEDVELVEGTDWIIGSESVVSLSPTAVANNPDGVKVSYKTYSVVDYDGSLGNSQGLAKPALEPAVRQSSVYYQNYQRDFAGPFELDTEVGDDVWTWYVASASSYIQLPDEFENLPVINIIANDELANYNDIEADEGVPYANYYKAYGGSTPDRRYVAQISFSDEGGDNFVYTAAIQFSVRITQTNITAPFYNKYDVDSWIDAFIINDDGGAYMFVDSYVDLNASAIGGLLYHDAYVTAVDDTPLERDTDWIIGGEGEVSLSPAAVIKNPQGVKVSYKTYSVVDYDDSYGEPQSITTFLPWTVPDGY